MTTEAQSVEVYAEATPNPEAIKFMINQTIAGSEPFDFRKVEEADKSPLAKSLFEFEFVDGVFIMNNFVSITKKPDYQWVELIPKIRNFLSEYIEAGHPIVDEELAQEAEEKKQSQSQEASSEDSEGKIKEILEQHVKPAIEMDGGAIQFKSFENGVVKLVLKGSCSGCPSSMVTLKQGIEGLLKRVVPEVESVEAEEG